MSLRKKNNSTEEKNMLFKDLGWNRPFIFKKDCKGKDMAYVYRKTNPSSSGNTRRESDDKAVTVEDNEQVISLET